MKQIAYDRLLITNPKVRSSRAGRERLFPYYAGYSLQFAENLLRSLQLDVESTILDPWNGSGTTTHIANQLRIKAIGFDLNPAMVIVAKAALLSPREVPSLIPLARSIMEQAGKSGGKPAKDDPLSPWLHQGSAHYIRTIHRN